MRVALVTSIAHGGPIEHALGLARGLSERGVEVQAVCATGELAERFGRAGARAGLIPLRSPGDWRRAVAVWRWVSGADVVHAHDRRSGLWTRLGPRPRAGGLRVYTAHGLPEPYLPPPAGEERPGLRAWLAYRQLDARLCRRADAVVVPSKAAARAFGERIGYPERALAVIPNGVEASEQDAWGELVGTIASLEPVKGVEVFVRAAARLADTHPGLGFAVYGSGPERDALEALARDLGLAGRIEFAGHVPAARALRSMRVFALSSHMETSGIALLEAMAAGVPAVATRVGGVPEIAVDGTVRLVESNDPAALADAVDRLLADEGLARQQAEAARARVRSNFTSEATAEATLQLYERLLQRR